MSNNTMTIADQDSALPQFAGPIERKTAGPHEELAGPAITVDAAGVWHVRSFDLARQILRSEAVAQAGFGAELMDSLPSGMRKPVLYQEGPAHHEQRIETARYFTPKWVSENYRAFMERYADELIDEFKAAGSMDLSVLSMKMAVQVAAQVVGLTDSSRPGLDKRLNVFFEGDITRSMEQLWNPMNWLRFVRRQYATYNFFRTDVKPAIRVRRATPGDDVISHLIASGYSDMEILTECVTYGAAGMITTREFICAATWHLLERPELHARYLIAPEKERHAILGEILRLEPVVGHLLRTTTAELTVADGDRTVTLPPGARIDLHVYAVNADDTVVDEMPHALCPDRTLQGASQPVMSFGDGYHRCPGAYVALHETDVFLQRLLALDGLRIESPPHVAWDDLVKGYEIRGFMLTTV
jgi:cytochrome P450